LTTHNEQGRTRDNLQDLGDRPAEKGLRERFVRTPSGQEDRLQKFKKEIEELSGARDRGRARMKEMLDKLEYEAKG
jgi:hypothetical protein